MMSAVLTASFLFAPGALAQEPKDSAAARSAAEHWLTLLDQGDTGAAWRASSAHVRKETNRFLWGTVMNLVRAPLGQLKSRKLTGSSDKGKGLLAFDYESRFEKEAEVRETVTLMQEPDGSWRMTGYNVNAPG